MKIYFVAASLLVLTACGQTAVEAPGEAPVVEAACNTVEPNIAVPAQMRGESTPSTSLPVLPGGAMQGGVYDLASGAQFDGAPSWEDVRHVSVLVTDTHEGTTLDWVEQVGADATTQTRWSARLETAPAALTFTCGRSGTVPISYRSTADELQLRMPDLSGTGTLELVFVRRG